MHLLLYSYLWYSIPYLIVYDQLQKNKPGSILHKNPNQNYRFSWSQIRIYHSGQVGLEISKSNEKVGAQKAIITKSYMILVIRFFKQKDPISITKCVRHDFILKSKSKFCYIILQCITIFKMYITNIISNIF